MENTVQNQDLALSVNPTDQPLGVGLHLPDFEVFRDKIEQQKANKLKAEQLGSTLSKIKAREKASRRSLKPGEKKNEDDIVNQVPKRSGINSSNALKEKSNLLKKKLEEDRAKLESKMAQDDSGRVSQLVEDLRLRLEDNEKTIQLINSTLINPKAPEETPPPEPNIPPEVKQKIADLEMKIIDLQENLREKDSVISARTQAITLLSEDMARKGKNTLDTLEETQRQMKMMQSNFAALEDRMNEEKTRLKDELEAKKIKLQQSEKNYRSAESARFELSTRAAELQEKIVAFQTKNITLEEDLAISSAKIKEMQEALDNNNKQTIKMKAQFKAKLKALEEEKDTLKKEQETNEELDRLREHIAELEDEKEAGNLLKERIAEMEEKIHRQEYDLDSHIKAITLLEGQKLDLVEQGHLRNKLLSEKEDLIVSLQSQIKEIDGTKVSLEMKCRQLEEKLEQFVNKENDTNRLVSELDRTNKILLEYKDTINELTLKLDTKENEITDIIKAAITWEDTSGYKGIQEIISCLTEWQIQYSDLSTKFDEVTSYCKKLEEKANQLEVENGKLLSNSNLLNVSVQNLNGAINSTSGADVEINRITEQNKTLEVEVDNLRYALESTTAEMNKLVQQVEEFNDIQKKLNELNAIIDSKDSELVQTKTELEKKSKKLSEYIKFHKLKCEDVNRISRELETVTSSFQERITELETALDSSQKQEQELRKEIAVLKENLDRTPESEDNRFKEQSLKIKKLIANLKLKTKVAKDLEAKVCELERSLQESGIAIARFEKEKQLNPNKVDHSNPGTVKSLEEKYNNLKTEYDSLKGCLKLKEEELQKLKPSSIETNDTGRLLKELENETKRLSEFSETKSSQLKKLETEMSDLYGVNKSLMSELEQMQETYTKDAVKNESVLGSFEKEVLGNQKDILELNNQFQEVTNKYELVCLKLQEKECYIEDLEQQFEKIKSRLIQIESTVEERRRSLEEKAEMLGARLNAAEINKEQLEQHGGELEHKISQLLDTEEIMSNILQKVKEENSEISKLLKETQEQNTIISIQLENERITTKDLANKLIAMQASITHYETMVEDYESSQNNLKQAQVMHCSRIKYLETQLTESELCLETETTRLLNRVAYLEAEKGDLNHKFESLLIEKQKVEEELTNIQQTIADVTKVEIEELKISHQQLSEKLNKELEKRQEYIYRIQALENDLLNEKERSESISSQYKEEILSLKNDLIKESAIRQVDDVVSKAEETYFTMITNLSKDEHSTSKTEKDDSNYELNDRVLTSKFDTDEIKTLQDKITTLTTENSILKEQIQECKQLSQIRQEIENSPDDDWTTVTKNDDDGWEWGSKEAMLEQEHLQKQLFNSELEAKLVEFEQKALNTEEENKRLREELKTSQTKCNKLLKKLKELKVKSDSLERNSREKSVGFDDLDIAMQEELLSQIEKLEKNLKECNTNLTSLQLERGVLLKRIETLTSGNETLVEMKERQDIDVEMLQRRNNQLQNKVQSLEWTIAELHPERNDSPVNSENKVSFTENERHHFLQNALEMEEKVNMLAAENDYLQSLIVDLKDQSKNANVFENKEEPFDVEHKEYLILKEENNRLNSEIEILNKKLSTNVDFTIIADENEILKNKNYTLSVENEKLRNAQHADGPTHEDWFALNERYNQMVTEYNNQKINVSSLMNDVSNFKPTGDKREQEINLPPQTVGQHEDTNERNAFVCFGVGDDKNKSSGDNLDNVQSDNSTKSSNNSTPLFFRGFGLSLDNESGFDVSLKPENNTLSKEQNLNKSSESSVVEFFIKPQAVPDNRDHMIFADMSPKFCFDTSVGRASYCELDELKVSLNKQNSELSVLKSTLTKCEEENKYLKEQFNKDHLGWDRWSVLHSPNSSQDESTPFWSNDISVLNTKIVEQDSVICDLKQKLSIKSDNQFDDLNKTFNDLFSQSDNSHENQVTRLVEQMTQLTNTLNEKEIEIEHLNDKKKKYKEMYHALLIKASPDQSNADKEQLSTQNILFNQMLEDKETELEMMSQRIEQTIVAKEILQDELSLKLCEMEAVNKTYETPSFSQNVMLIPEKPEHIEITSLSAEVAELTKLLHEKESESEMLKEQLEEAYLDKENLIDEWSKIVEEYKDKCNSLSEDNDILHKELYTVRGSEIIQFEKEYGDEITMKSHQLKNALNDLSDIKNKYEDAVSKLRLVEAQLQSSLVDNECLKNEIKTMKESQNSIQDLLQDAEVSHLNLVGKVKWLKSNFLDTKEKLTKVEEDIRQKEKEMLAHKEQLTVSSSNLISQKDIVESPVNSVALKTFGREPFKISTEQSSSDEDSSSRYTEYDQTFLLNEIQSMKQVLAMKDAEITRLSIALKDAQENFNKGEFRNEESGLRQYLDEALYTLHLRDVRCHELELELMQLLEERDSLQLRLSTAIRSNEDLRGKSTFPEEIVLKPSDGNVGMPNEGSSQQLKQKLDQLHTVGYNRDPSLQQDQQNRHQQQMQLYTQNAAQDGSQSASGFFNWIFGSSGSTSQDIA